MVKRWTEPKHRRLAVGFILASFALGCGESSSDGDEGTGGTSGGGASTGGSSGSSGSSTGGSTGGSGGSTTAGGSGGSAGSAGSANDPCGGCAVQELCIYQAGGPGPGHFLCAQNPICRAAGICDCIQNQGDCTPTAPGNDLGVTCQCDNGLE